MKPCVLTGLQVALIAGFALVCGRVGCFFLPAGKGSFDKEACVMGQAGFTNGKEMLIRYL